jgi:nucleoid DNA-binding protein
MIPKKPQEIIKQISEELDLPQSMVDAIITHYYKEFRKNLSSLEHIRLNLPGLGHFLIRANVVKKLTSKYNIQMEKYSTDTFTNYHNKKNAEYRLERLKHAREKIDEFRKKKKEFKDGRKTE